MADGKEEREEREKRQEQESKEFREDWINRRPEDAYAPERRES